MNEPRPDAGHEAARELCLTCGLCCDGTLFKDVQLQPADDRALLKRAGLRLTGPRSESPASRFAQPCAALTADCRCRIYASRPSYCRQFACLLLTNVTTGRTQPLAARRIIRTARERAEKVRQLLQQLGDDDRTVPLNQRFRRVAKRMSHLNNLEEARGSLFGELTLAVHDLNLLLSEEFYPGPAQE